MEETVALKSKLFQIISNYVKSISKSKIQNKINLKSQMPKVKSTTQKSKVNRKIRNSKSEIFTRLNFAK